MIKAVSTIPEFIDYVMIKAVSMKELPEFSQSSYNFRVEFSFENVELWLKHNSLSYPQIGKLIVASRDLDHIRLLAEWLKTIHVNGRYIGVTLTRAGGNVLERSMEEFDKLVNYLEDNGVRKDWMGYVNDFGTMLYDCPKVIGYFSMEEMNQKEMKLKAAYLKEFGLTDEDLGRLLAHKPQLMACSIEDGWKPLVKYFYYLGISKDGMRRILIFKPIIFCIDLESTIAPKVQFLLDIGVQQDAIGSMLNRFPSLMTYSLYKKIRPVVIFLLTRAGVSQLLLVSWHKATCFGGDDHGFPHRYNIDILRPKYQYLRRTMIRPLKDLIEFPRFFSYSLESRIIPRHRIMVENRVNFKLRYMLGAQMKNFTRE
ncbi:hypothetical protein SASPL_126098 [Salvia splendens]|uniref:mTERF domain-containing protein, mitochondrial n=1 Tax=Salvia splendens TaxID=180675 RepID=A0A8X8XIA1_SALSN|nr:hypothetical protein SASPL_126098 [Salvia splendens]